jgi:hypothetical protein
MKRKLHRIAAGLVCLLALPALALQLELLPLPVATNANSSFDLVLQISFTNPSVVPQLSVIPTPATFLLVGIGLVGMAFVRYRASSTRPSTDSRACGSRAPVAHAGR